MHRDGTRTRTLALGALATVLLCLLFSSRAAALEASLGDSFSSGEGTRSYDRGTTWVREGGGNGCHRSPQAWPRLLGVPRSAHFACSGAQTEDFFTPQKSGERAGSDGISQLERLRSLTRSRRVSRVYVTIGGNDLGFAEIIRKCLLWCLRHMEERELRRLDEVVVPKVTTALIAARRIAGAGRVVLIGYPDLIPQAGEEVHGCRWLSARERTAIRRLEAELNAAQAAAAAAAGVHYVSIRPALRDHELCSADPWVNAILGRDAPIAFFEQGHPTVEGQQAIARFLAGLLGGD